MSLPTVLRTKRCCRDNERSGNEIITFPLVVSLKASAILIFIASVQCKQRNLTARHLMAFPLRQMASLSQLSYRLFRNLRLFAPLTLSLSIECTWRMK